MLRSACVRLKGFLSAGRPFSSGCVPASDEEGVYYSPHGTIDIPNDRSFSHFLLEHAEQFGDKGSFEHARSLRGYSYSSLVQNAHSFASALQRLGLKNGMFRAEQSACSQYTGASMYISSSERGARVPSRAEYPRVSATVPWSRSGGGCVLDRKPTVHGA